MKFPLKIYSVNACGFVTFTEEFLMENFVFCAVKAYKINALLPLYFKALQEKKEKKK